MEKPAGTRVILLGAPGSGKGSQSLILKERLGLTHLSTGDMLREAVAKATELGKKAKEVMARGELVADEIVLGLVREAILERCPTGFILDGFPRTVVQAEGLDRLLESMNLSLTCVIHMEVDEAALVKRICGRRMHLPSGRIYHITDRPPKVEGLDDETGEPLTQRKDDNEETLRKRLAVYRNDTAPLIEYYARKGNLKEVDASKPIAEITKDLLDIIKPEKE